MRSNSSVSGGTGPKRSISRSRKASTSLSKFEVALHLTLVYKLLTADLARPIGSLLLLGIKIGKLIRLQFMDSLTQNFLVRFITQVGNEAALFGTQHVSGPADVQVLHGDMYAAAQVAEVLNGLQATPGFGREAGQGRCQQVAEGFFIAATHTASHLMQVTEAEVLCLVDDDGIRIGDVDAALNDGSGQQDVIIIIRKT